MSHHVVRLGPSELVAGRPFTGPARSLADAGALQHMAQSLCRFMQAAAPIPDQPRPLILYLEEAGERLHRLALVDPAALGQPGDLTVVGFSGQKRPGVDRRPLDALDQELIAELPHYAGLLSYSTLQLEDGNTCNLVLFSQPQAIQHWARSQKHTQAVQMSPDFYESIRLHQGRLSGGLGSNSQLILRRTNYYDYRGQPVWRAIRDLPGEGLNQ